MPVRTPLPFRPPAGEPAPPTSTLTAPPPRRSPAQPPADAPPRYGPSGRFTVHASDLRAFTGTCPTCGGPSPRLTVDVDPTVLQPPGHPSANFEEVAGYNRYFHANTCSACELRQLIARATPAAHGAAIVQDPAQVELASLRAELASRDTLAEPPAAVAVPDGALFSPGAVTITPAALGAAYRLAGCVGPDAEAVGYLLDLVGRHATGDHGLVGQHLDGDASLGAGANPLATQADRNAAAIEAGRGSIRSVYVRTRTETFRDPYSGYQERAGATHRYEFAVRTELPAGLTAVGLASELASG